MQTARDSWIAAATSRADWPQARRNVERALRRIDALERAKAERQRKREATAEAPSGAPNPPPREPDRVPIPEPPAPSIPPEVELTPSQIERLFEILRRDEAAKLETRRARRSARPAADPSERDW
jgi:hypothetical protein